jgi:hypothetical protein
MTQEQLAEAVIALAEDVRPLPVMVFRDEQQGLMVGVANIEPKSNDRYYFPVSVDRLSQIKSATPKQSRPTGWINCLIGH